MDALVGPHVIWFVSSVPVRAGFVIVATSGMCWRTRRAGRINVSGCRQNRQGALKITLTRHDRCDFRNRHETHVFPIATMRLPGETLSAKTLLVQTPETTVPFKTALLARMIPSLLGGATTVTRFLRAPDDPVARWLEDVQWPERLDLLPPQTLIPLTELPRCPSLPAALSPGSVA